MKIGSEKSKQHESLDQGAIEERRDNALKRALSTNPKPSKRKAGKGKAQS
ncbi:MAG: hypothetical protein KDE63_08450 [Novosphingobium sp.]|nr:hypothetical protein [Novosphingobium sp.]